MFLPQNGPYPKKMRNKKSEWHSGAGHVDGCCDLLGEFWTPPIKWGTFHFYRKSKKSNSEKPNVKLFTVAPSLEVIFKVALSKGA